LIDCNGAINGELAKLSLVHLIKLVARLVYWIWVAHEGREDEEEDVNSFWMTLRKGEGIVN
jgi:hypothetical protein